MRDAETIFIKSVISEEMLQIKIKFMIISCKIALRSSPRNTFDEKSTLAQVMAWWQQAITWANVDPDLCNNMHMVSVGHNELSIIVFKHVLVTDLWVHFMNFTLRWILQILTDDKSMG